MTVGGASTSMPVVAAAVPIPDPPRVATVHVGVPPGVPDFEFEAGPDRVENAMWDDDSDDEPVAIGGDSDDDIPSAVDQHQNVEATFASQGLHDANALRKFQIGQSFQSKEEAVLSVKDYSIQRGVEYRVMESDHLKYQGRCKEFGNECTWLICVTLRKRKSTWEVRRYNRSHTCLATSISSDYKQLDYHVICVKIFPLVRADASVTIKVLQEAMEATYGFRPSYRKPLVSIDGTHLYGKYGGMLLLAIAQDENSNILPIPFALVEGENAESWSYFLSRLHWRHQIVVGDLPILIGHSVIGMLLQILPSAFKGQDARRLLVNAAYAKREAEFYYWFDIMRTENTIMCEWANRMEYKRWTQHKDGGRRYGHMMTNISECVNSVLKGTRNLPVTSLVKSTYLRLAELFIARGQTAEA
ncbi:uncharacterized protein [Arachis hypogaea]|uniref:uncharacterized protein n=1 Tax=Arachis hypogaea TaxID=3818 RepID=UPI003B2269CE